MTKAEVNELQRPIYGRDQLSKLRRDFFTSLAAGQSTRQTIQELSRDRRPVTSSSVRQTRQPSQELTQKHKVIETLEDITYGVEVERYNLNISSRERTNVINDIRSLSKEEQKQRITEYLKVDETAQSRTTSALCFIKNSREELIMEVRLDGEREIATSRPGEEKKIHKSCFNMEFISVGAGIKKGRDFFVDVVQGHSSEISKVVRSFGNVVLNAKSDNPRVLEGGYTYEFTPLAIRCMAGSELGVRVKHNGEEQNLEKETAFHITHSIPLTDMDKISTPKNREYINKLGAAFDFGKDKDQRRRVPHGSETPRTAAKTVFVEAPSDPIASFTGDRNRSQPLLKEPLEYLVEVDGHGLQKAYLQSAKDQQVLQPTSNLVEYVKYDLEVYNELLGELEEKQGTILDKKSGDISNNSIEEQALKIMQQRKLKQLEKGIIKLSTSINKLTELYDHTINKWHDATRDYQSLTPSERSEKEDQLRLFESHDEKLQPVIVDGYRRGLVELRSDHPLKEVIKHHIFPETAPERSKDFDVRLNAQLITQDNISRGRKYINTIAEAINVVEPIVAQVIRREAISRRLIEAHDTVPKLPSEVRETDAQSKAVTDNMINSFTKARAVHSRVIVRPSTSLEPVRFGQSKSRKL